MLHLTKPNSTRSQRIGGSCITPSLSKSDQQYCDQIRSEKRCKPNQSALAYLYHLAAIQAVGGKAAVFALI